MLGTTFYNESIKKALVGFGTLFNDIDIERTDNSGNKEKIKIPFAYAPRSRIVTILQGSGGVGSPHEEVSVTLPRMSFEWTSINYDSSRKLNTMQRTATIDSSNDDRLKYRWQRVPYNLDLTLSVYVDNTEDGLKIIEQILPFFTPEFTLTITDVITHDMPIILTDVSQDDNWEGDFTDTRVIIWNLTFQLKTYLYGPEKTSKVVTKPINQFYADIFAEMDSVTDSTLTRAGSRITIAPNAGADADDAYTTTETKIDGN
tara:strand:+ start:2061 stop:2837 length:777 start_codon:yes stop_codon:yes gene_type:complete